MKTIPLTAMSREMQKLTDKPVPNYRKLYHAVVSGTVKAEQKPNGRWQVDADLTPVLKAFGLKA